MRLYQPQTRMGKVRKVGMRMGLGGGSVRLDEAALGRLERTFGRVLGRDQVRLAIYSREAGGLRKSTVHVMNPDGSPVAFAKTARSAGSKQALANAKQVLERLQEAGLKGFAPRVLATFARWESNFLVMSCGPGSAPPSTLGRAHESLLDVVRSAFGVLGPFEATRTYADAAGRLHRYRSRLTPEWRRRYESALKGVREEFGDEDVVTTLAHGDFVPWNTLAGRGGSLFAFDWEFSADGVLAPFDYFHFALMSELRLRRPLDGAGVRRLLREPWIQQFGRPQAHFRAFLLQLGLSCHERLFEHGEQGLDAVLANVATLLDNRTGWGSPL